MWPKALCVLVLLAHCCLCVIVKDGDYEFSLDSVKKLKELMDASHSSHQASQGDISDVEAAEMCASPELPEAFKLLCAAPNAAEIFSRLEPIAQNPDVCDVCAFAACSGC
uniref:Guanylate cyclase activator 2B n=1 Tax=Leptobrachium leishanense TaxID=445787 RepID=A0A8C5PFA9_9ANUR